MKGLGKKQREIISILNYGYIIRNVRDYRDMTDKAFIEDEEGNDTIMDVSQKMLQSLIDKDILDIHEERPCLQIEFTIFRLKK